MCRAQQVGRRCRRLALLPLNEGLGAGWPGRGWLSGKAMSIYGGSQEVQWNIISKRILGLPDSTGSA